MSIDNTQTLPTIEKKDRNDQLVEEMCKFIDEGGERGRKFFEFVLTNANKPFRELLEVVADQLPEDKKEKLLKFTEIHLPTTIEEYEVWRKEPEKQNLAQAFKQIGMLGAEGAIGMPSEVLSRIIYAHLDSLEEIGKTQPMEHKV